MGCYERNNKEMHRGGSIMNQFPYKTGESKILKVDYGL